MSDFVTVGDVAVIRPGPMRRDDDGDENPYRSPTMIGEDRARALVLWFNGTPPEGVRFWYAPAFGGARELHSPDEVRADERAWVLARGAARGDI